MAKFKTTYKYKGIEFASTSKVVAKKASQGDMRGAYEMHLSNTISRQMARADMSKAVRSQWVNSIVEGLRTEEEAKEALKNFKNIEKGIRTAKAEINQERRDIMSTAKEAGMSKKRRSSLKYQLYREGVSNEQAEEIVNEYLRSERYGKIRENVEGQYQSVLSILRDSDDPDIQEAFRQIEDIMEKYSLIYNLGGADSASQMAKEIKKVLENLYYWEEVSEKTAKAINNAVDSYDKVQHQIAVRKGFEEE